MKGDPHDFMRLGLVHFMAYPRVAAGRGPILDSLEELCRDDYFQLIEITQIKRDSVRTKAREMLRAAGRAVAFGAQPIMLREKLDLNDPDTHDRTDALDRVKEIMNEAAGWRATFFEVVSGVDPGREERDSAMVRLISSLKELCEASRTHNAPPVLLETFDRQPWGKNRLIGPTDDAVHVARAVAPYYPRFGLVIDLSHLPLLSESPAEALSKASRYLKHVHVGNCVMRDPDHPAFGDEHPPFGVEGGENGPEQLAAFLRALLDIGYLREGSRNTVSFEVKPLKRQKTADALDCCKKCLDSAWKAI